MTAQGQGTPNNRARAQTLRVLSPQTSCDSKCPSLVRNSSLARGPLPRPASPWKRGAAIPGAVCFPFHVYFFRSVVNNSGTQTQSLGRGSCQLPDFSCTLSPRIEGWGTAGCCHGDAVTSGSCRERWGVQAGRGQGCTGHSRGACRATGEEWRARA